MTNTAGFFLIGVLGVVIGGVVLQQRNPAGFSRVEDDFLALFSSAPLPPETTPAAPSSNAPPMPSGPSPVVEKPVAPANTASHPAAPSSPPTAQTAASPNSAPAPAPVVAWAPPDPLPAKPNWTWTTTDGHTYKNVVIQKVGPVNVSIMHDLGVATVDISALPADLQKQLNYDPTVAEASNAASQAAGLNYFAMDAVDKAKILAQKEGLPLVWLCGWAKDLAALDAPQESSAMQTQMAMTALQGQAVIIYIKADTEMDKIPANVHEQLYQTDDGTLPNGHHFIVPKIVFTSSDGTKALGRVSETQMASQKEAAITSVLGSLGTN